MFFSAFRSNKVEDIHSHNQTESLANASNKQIEDPLVNGFMKDLLSQLEKIQGKYGNLQKDLQSKLLKKNKIKRFILKNIEKIEFKFGDDKSILDKFKKAREENAELASIIKFDLISHAVDHISFLVGKRRELIAKRANISGDFNEKLRNNSKKFRATVASIFYTKVDPIAKELVCNQNAIINFFIAIERELKNSRQELRSSHKAKNSLYQFRLEVAKLGNDEVLNYILTGKENTSTKVTGRVCFVGAFCDDITEVMIGHDSKDEKGFFPKRKEEYSHSRRSSCDTENSCDLD